MAPIPMVYAGITGMNISAWVRMSTRQCWLSPFQQRSKNQTELEHESFWNLENPKLGHCSLALYLHVPTVHACIDSREYCIHHSMGTEKKGAFLGKVLSCPIPLLLKYFVSQSDQLSNLLNNTTNCSWVRGQHHLKCQVSFTISSSMKSSFSFTSIPLCHLIPNSSVLFSIGAIKACILLRKLASTREGDCEVVQKVSSLLVEYASFFLEKLIPGLGRTGPCLIHSNPIIPSPQYPLILKLWEATL